MNRWGALLLVAYLVLGLSRFGGTSAVRRAVLLTGAVLLLVQLKSGTL